MSHINDIDNLVATRETGALNVRWIGDMLTTYKLNITTVCLELIAIGIADDNF